MLMLLITLTLGLVSCTTQTTVIKPTETKGILYKLQKDNKTIYLFGTYHIGDSSTENLNTTVLEALKSSDILMSEVNIFDENYKILKNKLMYYPEGETFRNHISSESINYVERVAADYGYDLNSNINTNIFDICQDISELQLSKNNLSYENAIDSRIQKLAQESNIKIEALESNSEHLNYIYAQDDEFIEYLAITSIFSKGTEPYDIASYKSDLDMYKNGVEAHFENMYKSQGLTGEDDDFYNIMIKNRNLNMYNNIILQSKNSDIIFVAAGLFHLYGDDSLINKFKDSGFDISNCTSGL